MAFQTLFFIFVILSLSFTHVFNVAQAKMCKRYLERDYSISIQDVTTSKAYIEVQQHLEQLHQEQSVRKIVTLFHEFKEGYHERYDDYVTQMIKVDPQLESNHRGFKEATEPFMVQENFIVEHFQNTLLQISAKKRWHYVRSLPLKKLKRDTLLLDALFGIGTNKVLDFIHSDWDKLIRFIDGMDLPLAPQIIGLDLHTGKGARFGLLLKAMQPEAKVINVVPHAEQAQLYNNIVRSSGLKDIFYITEKQLSSLSLDAEALVVHLFEK